MKKLLFICATLVALCLAACESSENNSTPKERKDIPLTRTETEINVLNQDFAFRFFQAVNSGADEQQLIVSPLSAAFALSMTANGAEGDTRQEIINALGFGEYSMDEVNAYQQKLTQYLTDLDNTSLLYIANSMWLHNDFSVLNSFKQTLTQNYAAEIRTLDLTKKESIRTINKWCAGKTNNYISSLLDEKVADDEYKFFILNALYFKGIWTDPFKKKNTATGDFVNQDGTVKQVEFMKQTDSFGYTIEENFALAEFPYGNEAFSLVVLLPHEGVDVESCIEALDGETWEKVQKMPSLKLSVKLPKFKLECKQNLIPALEAMGVHKAFTQEADFSNLTSEENIIIGLVNQANSFSINENGVEAASTTVVGGLYGANSDLTIPEFHVTRPFLFFIKEKSTGAMLFMGKVAKL